MQERLSDAVFSAPRLLGLAAAFSATCTFFVPAGMAAEPAAATSIKHEGAVVFAGGGGGQGDVLKALLADFGTKYGVKTSYVEGVTASNYAKIQAQMKSGNLEIDTFQSNNAIDHLGRAQNAFQALDMTLIPNAKRVLPSAVPADKMGVVMGTTVYTLAYRKDTFQKRGWSAPTSWTDLWNPKYDCIALHQPAGGGGSISIAMMNYVASGGKYDAIDATIAKLRPIKDKINVVLSSPEAMQALEQGSACIAPTNEVRAYLSTNPAIGTAVPKEGSAFDAVPVQLIKGAPHPIAGQLWINYLLSDDAQNVLLTKINFSPVSLNVKRPSGGNAAKVTLASQFAQKKITRVPDNTFDAVEDWDRKWKVLIGR